MSYKRKYDYFESSDIIHKVADICISNNAPKDHGTGEMYTSSELHMLKYIVDHPGVTATDTAHDWNKTRGAATQMLSKLERKELLRRGDDPYNNKKVLYYATEKGLYLNEKHREYDTINFGKTYKKLVNQFSEKDVETTIEVIRAYGNLLVEENWMQKHKSKLL
jgi:DNA-binding MarR family transcriptional regulator